MERVCTSFALVMRLNVDRFYTRELKS
uniref:Uncharacterized protein n=1 Tax=Arundo donax TaxID=35708 RepID=A0A0A9H5X8_ARUDO